MRIKRQFPIPVIYILLKLFNEFFVSENLTGEESEDLLDIENRKFDKNMNKEIRKKTFLNLLRVIHFSIKYHGTDKTKILPSKIFHL